MQEISSRLTLEQACATSHREAEILAAQNKPAPDIVKNIRHTATTIYEPYLDLVGGALLTSFWRSVVLNKHIGGARRSSHLLGLAFDSIPQKVNLVKTLVMLSHSSIPFDNALIEWGWIHIAAPLPTLWPRRKLTMSFGERDSKGDLIVHAFDPMDQRLEKYT